MYGLFGRFIAVEGQRDSLLKILLEASGLLQDNPDCIHYLVGTSADDTSVWVSEVWSSKEAHDAALSPENIRSLIMTARPLILDMPEGTEYAVVGGKGL